MLEELWDELYGQDEPELTEEEIEEQRKKSLEEDLLMLKKMGEKAVKNE